MKVEIHINEQLLAFFEIEEPDLTGWDNCEARIKTREYYLKQLFLEKEPLPRNLSNVTYYLNFKSKWSEEF